MGPLIAGGAHDINNFVVSILFFPAIVAFAVIHLASVLVPFAAVDLASVQIAAVVFPERDALPTRAKFLKILNPLSWLLLWLLPSFLRNTSTSHQYKTYKPF